MVARLEKMVSNIIVLDLGFDDRLRLDGVAIMAFTAM